MATQSQLNDVIKQNKHTNVTLYHENDIKGRGVKILVIDDEDQHWQSNIRRVYDSAPEANIICAGMESISKNNEFKAIINYKGNRYDFEDFIRDNKFKIITRSLGGGTAENTIESKFYKTLRDKYNLIINQSSGNKKIGASIPHDVSIWWSGVTLNRYDNPIKATWSASGEQIDFSTFSGFYIGTSFCSPFGAGMEALIISRYGDYGLNMSHKEIFNYLMMICEDLYEEGHDEKVGHGIPILPLLDKKYISMTTKSNIYYVDGIEKKMDCVPKNIEGNVFVPVRALAESLGYTITPTFNKDKTIHIIITNGKTEVILNTDNDLMYVNGTQHQLNFAPFIDENNRTLVPIRAIVEAFNCKVSWVQSESKVMILEN